MTTRQGGGQVSLEWFNLDQRIIRLKTEGLDLPVQPERTVITVSTKPAVALVWLGVIVTIVGGLVAFLRRSFEGEAWLTGQRLRLPKGLAWRWRASK
jgi:cytochrome c-type biogenesis protein CcmF